MTTFADPKDFASTSSTAQIQTERAMLDLETYLRNEEGIEVREAKNHVASNLPDSTMEFDLEVDVEGGTRVTLVVGDLGGEFYVEVRRTVDTTTTCLKFREVVRTVKKHARDWA